MKIELKDISFSYTSQKEVVKDFNLTIEPGQMISIIGHNGSGKSTIAKLIMGLLKADSGEIYFDGTLFCEENVDDFRLKLGIIFQNPDNQFVGVTVKDDIAFGLENHRIPHDEMVKRIDYYSKLVNMEEFLNANPENLSGGQKQRVAIAGVLAMDTEVIIFDEATSMLDPKGTKEIIQTIQKLRNTTNKTIVMITHNLEEVVFSDRVVVLKDGEKVLEGTPKEVLQEKKCLIESGLGVIDSITTILEVEKSNHPKKEELVNALWELTFEM